MDLDDEVIIPEEDVRRLTARRDDAGRTLFELLADENVPPHELIRMKHELEENGEWMWHRSRRLQRLRRLGCVAEPRSASGRAEANRTARTRETAAAGTSQPAHCTWRGRDEVGNIWWCLAARFVHGATGESFTRCAYHIRACVAAHPSVQSPRREARAHIIAVPNNAALCSVHFLAAYGHAPESSVSSPFKAPHVAFHAFGSGERHPLAPTAAADGRTYDKRAPDVMAAAFGVHVDLLVRKQEGYPKGIDSVEASACNADPPPEVRSVRTIVKAAIGAVTSGLAMGRTRRRAEATSAAAIIIQSAVRGWAVRRHVGGARRRAARTARVDAALLITRVLRGAAVRTRVRANAIASVRAAITIQRAWCHAVLLSALKRVRRATAAAVRLQVSEHMVFVRECDCHRLLRSTT